MQIMFAHLKIQVENSRISESSFTIDPIMHSHINFHKLVLPRDTSSVEMRERTTKKKEKNSDKSKK